MHFQIFTFIKQHIDTYIWCLIQKKSMGSSIFEVWNESNFIFVEYFYSILTDKGS